MQVIETTQYDRMNATAQRRVFEQAMQTKDPRFDGRFFIGVRTTGVYCRPVCPVKSPKLKNVIFYPTAAAAAEAGFRPCLRCRPEASPGTPAWSGTSTTVVRGLRLIGEGALDEDGVEALSNRLGVTSRHLSRLFMEHLGASPKAVAQTRRLHFAKKLLNETDLSMTEVALASGYGSVRRFNDHMKQVYARTPSQLRGRAAIPVSGNDRFSIRLSYRPPYDFDGMLNFFAVRATPGIEQVVEGTYIRTIAIEDECGTVAVSKLQDSNQLLCEIDIASARHLMRIVDRIRRTFDLDADPLEIGTILSRDKALAPMVRRNPGQRVPGTWSPFEVAVRAIAGQQISVKGATTVMGVIAQKFGHSADGLSLFPAPESLARIKAGDLPMPGTRALAIRDMSRAVMSGALDLSTGNGAQLNKQLLQLKGIGPWTAQYVAMRACSDPDAFLSGDLVLRKIARSVLNIDSERALIERSEAWRPWRAYAGMHLWSMASSIG